MGDHSPIKLSLMNLIGIGIFVAAVLGIGFLIGSVGKLSFGPKDNLAVNEFDDGETEHQSIYSDYNKAKQKEQEKKEQEKLEKEAAAKNTANTNTNTNSTNTTNNVTK